MAKRSAARGRAPAQGGARLDLLLPRDWPQTPAPIEWRLRSASGETQSGKGQLDALPRADATPVRVWTPATETLLTQTTLPTRSRTMIERALPGALEDQLLDDPAQLHFSWRREGDGPVFVAVTAKERIKTWMQALQQAGIKPATLCPATLAVPWSPGCWSAAFVDDELLVRTGPVSGFTVAGHADPVPALLLANLKQAQQGTAAPEYFIVFQPPSAFHADIWSAALGVPVRVEAETFWDVPGDSEPALNLLQGAFAPAGEIKQHLKPWIPAAAMLALWLLGTIVFDGIEWWRLHRQQSELTREMAALLLSAFPDIKNPDYEPMRQMQTNMERLQARGGMRPHDMLPLLARTARAWQTVPGAKLKNLRYNERSLTLEATFPNTQTVETFRGTLQSSGVQVEVLASTARASEVEARLRVKPNATATSTKP